MSETAAVAASKRDTRWSPVQRISTPVYGKEFTVEDHRGRKHNFTIWPGITRKAEKSGSTVSHVKADIDDVDADLRAFEDMSLADPYDKTTARTGADDGGYKKKRKTRKTRKTRRKIRLKKRKKRRRKTRRKGGHHLLGGGI